jgi:dihydrofolate reductase
MRTVIYGAACSLDGFIAGPNDELDWLRWSDDVARISSDVLGAVDTVLMGRRTYEVAVRNGTRSYPGAENIVFSRTLDPRAFPEVTVVAEDARAHVARLVERPGRGICVLGGGQLAGALFSAGLVHQVGLNIHPVLLGRGIPMFVSIERPVELALTEARELTGGCVYLRYDVKV